MKSADASPDLPAIAELSRRRAPLVTPQALAWHRDALWISSRDESRLCGLDPRAWTAFEETPAPGVPWGAVSTGDALCVVVGEGAESDRYLRRYTPNRGWDETWRVALPDLTGSYLGFDGEHLHVSQWYNHRILRLDAAGSILREIAVGAEICGQAFAGDHLYVLLGTEQDGESWRIARLDPREENPRAEDLARVPFACRSLAWDGERFWTNHRAANETVSFALPGGG